MFLEKLKKNAGKNLTFEESKKIFIDIMSGKAMIINI